MIIFVVTDVRGVMDAAIMEFGQLQSAHLWN
jgi:hypothetical protein